MILRPFATLLSVLLPASTALPVANDRDRLNAGEAIVRLETTASPGEPRLGEIRRVLDQPADRLFRAILDCHHYREFMPYVTASDGKLVAQGTIDCRQTVKTPFSRRLRSFTVRLRPAGSTAPDGTSGKVTYTASWSLAPGSEHDIETSRGRWTLTEWSPGRTLVHLRWVQDFRLPTRLQDRATSASLPWILDGLRQQTNRCRYDVPRAAGCREAPPILPSQTPRP
ncbi:MAG: SRPBCC family protein [Acidobacteriota bacterium]